ncbi:MAG: GMC family oxidoreductase N-terminal domain-containing protein [Microthrixaceae bacterium]
MSDGRPTRIDCDVAVVGAGSAGCALAGRLRARGVGHVLLVDPGPDPSRWPPDRRAALDAAGRLDAAYDPATSRGDRVALGDGRAAELRRGVVLGGSSAVNGTYFVHSRAADVAVWEAATAGVWSAERVARLVERLEADQDLGGRDGHGAHGPVPVSRDASASRVTDAFFGSCAALGHSAQEDLNDRGTGTGYGLVPRNVRDGRRVSTAQAYLAPLVGDAGLTVCTDTTVDRLVLDGATVTGLVGSGPHGPLEVHAEQVVLCAGAVGSPALLHRSGLGANGAVRVGARAWNHPVVELMYRPRAGVVDPGVDGFLQGALHTPTHEVLATRLPYGAVTRRAPADDLLSLRVTLLTPRGTAALELGSAAPFVRHDPLEHAEDRAALRSAVRHWGALAASRPFADLVEERHGPAAAELSDDARLDDWIRRRIEVAFHLGGTCPVGTDPGAGAVVDPALRVHGVDGLRVADVSVLPEPLSRGPAATAVLLGELAADELTAGTTSSGS